MKQQNWVFMSQEKRKGMQQRDDRTDFYSNLLTSDLN